MKTDDFIADEAFTLYVNDVKRRHSYFNIVISDEVYVGNGSTYDYYGQVDAVVAGVKRVDDSSTYTYGDLTSTLIALYHEIGHARQVSYEFKEKSDISTVLALNHYARKCSLAYYDSDNLDDGNYVKQPTEIAAQYFGLKMTYNYLSENINPESANQLICDYVNNEVASNFIPVDAEHPYTNVQDIFDKYNDVFNERIYEHRDFKPDKNKYNDVYSVHGNKLMTLQLQAESTSGLRQDAILTSLYMEKSSEKECFDKNIIKAFDDVPFDKIKNFISGNKHVPMVQRINLDTLMPDYNPVNPSDDYSL